MKDSLLVAIAGVGAVALLAACGSSDSSKTAANSTGSGGQSARGGAGGAGGAGAAGSGGANGKAGDNAGTGATAGTGGGAGTGPGCMDSLTSGDATCPSSPSAFPASDTCSKEGATCRYQLATSTPGVCVNSAYTCCGGMWIGADACPMPVTGQPAGCPTDLPSDSDPFNPPACSSAGLQCGYYPVDGMLEQDIGCCSGKWVFCFPATPGNAPNCPCP